MVFRVEAAAAAVVVEAAVLVKAHLIISGRVQGVFYRSYTKKKAQGLHLSGWVKNTNNSQVETIIVGPAKQIKKMVSWLAKGSPLSKVKQVKIISQEKIKKDSFSCFKIRT